jgi:hypothetical protein
MAVIGGKMPLVLSIAALAILIGAPPAHGVCNKDSNCYVLPPAPGDGGMHRTQLSETKAEKGTNRRQPCAPNK